MVMKPMVYLAGPITKPDTIENVRAGLDLYIKMINDDIVTPFCPHLSYLVPLMLGGRVDDYDFWLKHDFEVIHRCDALFRMPGESYGADKEVAYAHKHGIPVYTLGDRAGGSD